VANHQKIEILKKKRNLVKKLDL